MDKLISMTDFVLSGKWDKASSEPYSKENLDRITKYANFLKRPLELGMFIPCVDGEPIEKRPTYMIWSDVEKKYLDDTKEAVSYRKAKDNVLFKGIKIHSFNKGDIEYTLELEDGSGIVIDLDNETIEDLIKYNLTFTDKALKLWN